MNQSYRSDSPELTRFTELAGEQTQRTPPAQAQRLSLLAAAAIVGQGILLATAWLLPLVSPSNIVNDTISEMALGPYGLVLTLAFVLSGLGVLGLAYSIRQLTAGAWGSRAGSLLIGVYGVGAILSAFFPTDRIDSASDLATLSTTGMIHSTVALVSFVSAVAGMVILAWTFSKAARWRSLLPWAAVLATGGVSLMLGQIVEPLSPWAGLLQRLLVTIIAAWLIAAALRVRNIALSAHEVSG